MSKQSLTDDGRQEFIDKLPSEQIRPNAEEVFDSAISRAAQPKQSKLEKPEPADGYTDTQTHSDTTEDTLDSHSDKSHQ